MPEPTLDLLTADGEALRRWFDKRDCEQRDNRAVFVQLRDAIVAAARSAPVGELTEAMVAQAFSETLDEQDSRDPFSIRDWDSLSAEKKRICVFFARAIARLARPSDAVLAEAKRAGWDAARAFANEKWGITPRPEHWDAERDRRWPPAPPAPPTPSVRCALCKMEGADLSTGLHASKDECIEALGTALAAQVAPERAK